MDIQLKKIFNDTGKPKLILGPCSAETEEQVLKTAEQIHSLGIEPDLFRAGIWKPRTRPNSFEGIGAQGLDWLVKVREKYGWKVTTEVANREHTEAALKAGIDVLWLGARTTVNPFSVQEVADVLKGVEIPVLVKNPINPDLKLWMGGIERIYQSGITRLGAIHRGFSKFGSTVYRNVPQWQIPIDLKRNFPGIEIICDSSHICGNRENLFQISQMALDLGMDGMMLETHCNPDEAWSDAQQQVTPFSLKEQILDRLVVRKTNFTDPNALLNIEDLRSQIDVLDKELLELLGNRMAVSKKIGTYKKENGITVYQPARWNVIIEKYKALADAHDLSHEFTSQLVKLIHQESINHQEQIMVSNDENVEA